MSHVEEPVLRAEAVTVRYGKQLAVEDAALTVPRGSVYALLGRNGAGKSSLVRCLVGLQKPEKGSITIFGDDVWRHRAKLMNRVGIVAEDSDAPPAMTVEQIGEFCGRLHARWEADTVNDRLKRFAIKPQARFGNLSKGQKKQVMPAMKISSSVMGVVSA